MKALLAISLLIALAGCIPLMGPQCGDTTMPVCPVSGGPK